VDHSRFRRLTDAHRRSVVAGVTSFLVASAFVPALASTAHAAGSRPTSPKSRSASPSAHAAGSRPTGPKSRSASPTARASLSTYDAIQGYGNRVAEKIKGGDLPEHHGFEAVSLAELGRMYDTEVRRGVFTLIASRMEYGEVKEVKFLAPNREDGQIVYGNSYDEKKLTGQDLEGEGYRNFFVRTFDRPASTGETGAPEAAPAPAPAPAFAGHLPAGSVKDAITGTVASGGVKAVVLRHLYSANNGERVFSPKDLADELDDYNGNVTSDRNELSGYLGRLAAVGLIKKTKGTGHGYHQTPDSYQALSPNEVATENARPLQDRVRDVVGRGGITARVLQHLYRSGINGEFASKDVHDGLSEENTQTATRKALADLADAGLIRRVPRPEVGKIVWYRLVEGVVLS
jgi:hypothetical protein